VEPEQISVQRAEKSVIRRVEETEGRDFLENSDLSIPSFYFFILLIMSLKDII